MREIASGESELLILDGAVLRAEIGGIDSFFEADEMAIGVHGQIVIGENKSWPVVDGRPTDEDALGSALDQAATYTLLGRHTLEALGIDPASVSSDVVIVTPRNTGLSPVLHRQNVDGRIRRIARLLERVPDVADIATDVPAGLTFDAVADTTNSDDARLAAFAAVTDELGNWYRPGACLTSCGFAWACRESAFHASDPALAGGMVGSALPGVVSLDRLAELGHGAPASTAEASATVPITLAVSTTRPFPVAPPTRRRSA